MDIRQVPQLPSDFIEVEARALRERDQDDLVKGRLAVAALAPARLAFGRDQAELLVVTQRRCRHGGALGHLADVDQLIGGPRPLRAPRPALRAPRTPAPWWIRWLTKRH